MLVIGRKPGERIHCCDMHKHEWVSVEHRGRIDIPGCITLAFIGETFQFEAVLALRCSVVVILPRTCKRITFINNGPRQSTGIDSIGIKAPSEVRIDRTEVLARATA